MNKKNKRRLALKSDTVRMLNRGDLQNIVGGLIPTGSPTGFVKPTFVRVEVVRVPQWGARQAARRRRRPARRSVAWLLGAIEPRREGEEISDYRAPSTRPAPTRFLRISQKWSLNSACG